MIKLSLDVWLLAICIVLPSLCLIMTILIYIKRGRNLSCESNSENYKENKRKFADEIAFNLACQQLDELMINTIDNIEKQRQFLYKYIDKQYKSNINILQAETDKKNIIGEISSEKEVSNIENISHENDAGVQINNIGFPGDDYNYRCIDELFQSGMTSKQISDKTKIPQSEIDLYIKLHLNKISTEKSPVSLFRLTV